MSEKVLTLVLWFEFGRPVVPGKRGPFVFVMGITDVNIEVTDSVMDCVFFTSHL